MPIYMSFRGRQLSEPGNLSHLRDDNRRNEKYPDVDEIDIKRWLLYLLCVMTRQIGTSFLLRLAN